MSQEQTLEPCPFCGSSDIRMHVYGESTPGEPDAFAQCHDCTTTGPNGHDRASATEAWNRRAALSATQPAQAAQGEPAEHWHRLYLEKCQQYNDRVAQLGGVIEGLEAEAAQGAGEVDTGPRVLREVLSVCEDTMDKMALETTEFSRGRAFEAKGISRAIGTWFQDEFCGLSHMGEPVAAPTQPAAGADVLDAKRWQLRCETLRALFPSAPSDYELDTAIGAAIAASGRQE